ncbi:MAG: GDP-mannose 4,6-dehydratase [Candidatus Hydrogenedentota bacterium]|nr:MAG: GDP-mannose 4,6-dehydratase [Candidatus Hydrogenedentota bacterium]
MKALITGIGGQDGYYLTRLLLKEGVTVFGVARDQERARRSLGEVSSQVTILSGDLAQSGVWPSLLSEVKPDEIYNLAAQTSVPRSWQDPVLSARSTALSVLEALAAIRDSAPKTRFFQASSSAMYGEARESPQTEETPFFPNTPYGTAKLFAHYAVINFREGAGLFAVNGILFNHESPFRSPNFVTRKITLAAARIAAGKERKLKLGRLDTIRDWGFAGDYVRAMRAALRADAPTDYVIASGETHSVREVVEIAFGRLGLNWKEYVETDSAFYRVAEADRLVGDSSRARRLLGWKPTVSFRALIEMMVDRDVERVARGEDEAE